MREFFRKYVLANLGLKLLSLFLAVLLWWAVAHDPTVQVPMTVPVEFHHTPQNLVISSESPFQVQIELQGPERTLRSLNPSQVHAVIDLQGAAPGERTFDLTADQIRVPRDVEVVQVVPSQFHISFDHTRHAQCRCAPARDRVAAVGLRDWHGHRQSREDHD